MIMRFGATTKIFHAIVLTAIVLAFALLYTTASSAREIAFKSAISQSSQQNQTPPQDKPPEDKPTESKKDSKPADPTTTKLRIHVVNADDKPVSNAAVYVRFPVAGGFLHKDKLSELSLKTNEDGSVKVPDIPRGKILIQVIAKGWKTFGKWYEIDSEAMTVEIKLEPPAHWY